MVVADSAFFLLGRARPAVALGRVGDDRDAIRHRPLRRQNRKISGNGAGQVGLLHGSPARLLFPVLGDHWLCLYPSGTLAFQVLILLAICSGYEVSTFLVFATTDRFKISYLKFGPTEFRLALIVINALLVQYGTRQMVNGLKYVNIGGAIGLALMIYKTHKMFGRSTWRQRTPAPGT